MSQVPGFFTDYAAPIDEELRRLVPPGGDLVQQSMAYTVHAPSKRVRFCGAAKVVVVRATKEIAMVSCICRRFVLKRVNSLSPYP